MSGIMRYLFLWPWDAIRANRNRCRLLKRLFLLVIRARRIQHQGIRRRTGHKAHNQFGRGLLVVLTDLARA